MCDVEQEQAEVMRKLRRRSGSERSRKRRAEQEMP